VALIPVEAVIYSACVLGFSAQPCRDSLGVIREPLSMCVLQTWGPRELGLLLGKQEMEPVVKNTVCP
jgi:hypothetical protein